MATFFNYCYRFTSISSGCSDPANSPAGHHPIWHR